MRKKHTKRKEIFTLNQQGNASWKFWNSNFRDQVFLWDTHCVRSVPIRIFSGPYFPAFGLNTERYGTEKIRMRTLFTQWRVSQMVMQWWWCMSIMFQTKQHHTVTKTNEKIDILILLLQRFFFTICASNKWRKIKYEVHPKILDLERAKKKLGDELCDALFLYMLYELVIHHPKCSNLKGHNHNMKCRRWK